MLRKLYFPDSMTSLAQRTLLVLGLMVATILPSMAQSLGTYTFTGTGLVSTRNTATSVNANVTYSGLTNNTLTDASQQNEAGYSNWGTAVTINTGKYVEFTITPNLGVTMNLGTVTFTARRSGTGPQNIDLRSSIDSYASNLNGVNLSPGNGSAVAQSVSLSSGTFGALTAAVTFRIYGYNPATLLATTGNIRLDGLSINGTALTATPSITLFGTFFQFDGTTAAAGNSQSFDLSAANLTGFPGNISVSAPSGYQVSTDNSSFASSVNVAFASATVGNTTLFARQSTGSASLASTGNISAAGGTATSNNLAVTGVRASPYTSGNLVVLRAGDGVNSLGNTGNQISIVEFSPAAAGSPLNARNFPVYGDNPIIQSNTATSEGALTRTPDGTKLVFGGYKRALPNITSISTTTSAVVNRVVATVTNDGTIAFPAATSTGYSAGNIRGAASTGTRYFASGQTSTSGQAGVRGPSDFSKQLTTAFTNTRNVRIINGRVVFNNNFNSGLLNIGLISLGMGIENNVINQTEFQVVTAGTGADQYDFSISPDGRTIYIADIRTAGITITSGGIQRWDYNQTTGIYDWVRTFPTSVAAAGAQHLNVTWGSGTNIIYATSGEGSNNNLIKITDDGTASAAYATMVTAGKVVVLATAGANFLFRGVEFAPEATAIKAITLTTAGLGGVSGSFQNSSVGNGSFGSYVFGATNTRTLYVSGTGLNSTDMTITLTGLGASKYGIRLGGSGLFSSGPLSIPASSYDADGNLQATRVDIQFTSDSPAATSIASINVSGGGVSITSTQITANSVAPTFYYLINSITHGSSVDLTNLSNWTTDITGLTSVPPADFTADGQIFVVNKTISAITSTFSVSGNASEIQVANGKTFTTSAAVTGTVSITGSGTFAIADVTTNVSFGTLHATSKVVYGAAGAQTIPASTFGSLSLAGTGNKTFTDGVQINDTLTFGATTTATTPGSNVNIFYAGDIVVNSGATFSSNWNTFAIVRANGNGSSIISGTGVLRAAEFRIVDKAIGFVTLKTDINVGSVTTNLSGNAAWFDDGNTITVSNNLQLNGAAGGYVFTGTMILAGTSGTQQIRNSNALSQAVVAQFQNLTLNQSGTATVNFNPTSGNSIITIKGNLTINHTSSGTVLVNSNTLRIRGNLVRTAGAFIPSASSTLEFTGAAAFSITGAAAFTLGNLIVDAGIGSLSVPDLNLTGSLTLTSGNLDLSAKTVTLIGTSAQTITGIHTINNLEVSNVTGSTLASGSTININRELKLNTNSILTVSGATFRLLSSATQTAYLAAVPLGAGIVGSITAQRTLANPSKPGWYCLTSPVKGITLATLNSQIQQFGYAGVTAGNPSTYFHDETVVANDGWVVPTAASNAISGVGFRAYAKQGAINSSFNKLSFTGEPIIGNGVDNINAGGNEAFAYTITNTATGYNLVANPFAAAIDWNNTTPWVATNISPTIHKWDVVSGSYKVWNSNTSSGTSASGVIPSFSSFVIQSAGPGAASLAVREAAKVSATNLWVARQGDVNTLRLKLDNGNTNNDEAILAFDANGSRTTTINDASKLYGGTIDMALVVDGKEFTTKYLNDQTANQVVDLKVKSFATGSHTLHINGISTLTGVSVSLRDNTLGTLTVVNSDLDHNFTVAAGTTSGTNRFSLIFTNTITGLGNTLGQQSATLYPNPSTGTAVNLQLTGMEAGQQVTIRITDAAGKVVNTQNHVAAGLQDTYQLPTLVGGIYIVNARTGSFNSTQKLVIK